MSKDIANEPTLAMNALSEQLDNIELHEKQSDCLSSGDISEVIEKTSEKMSSNILDVLLTTQTSKEHSACAQPGATSSKATGGGEHLTCVDHGAVVTSGTSGGQEVTTCAERPSGFWKASKNGGAATSAEHQAVFTMTRGGDEEIMSAEHAEALCKMLSEEVVGRKKDCAGAKVDDGLPVEEGSTEDDRIDYCRDVISTVDFLHQNFPNILMKYYFLCYKLL